MSAKIVSYFQLSFCLYLSYPLPISRIVSLQRVVGLSKIGPSSLTIGLRCSLKLI